MSNKHTISRLLTDASLLMREDERTSPAAHDLIARLSVHFLNAAEAAVTLPKWQAAWYIPDILPVKWLDRTDKNESLETFIKREYKHWIEKELPIPFPLIKEYDKSLYHFICNYKSETGKYPGNLDIRTLKEMNDLERQSAESDSKKGRLYSQQIRRRGLNKNTNERSGSVKGSKRQSSRVIFP